MTRWTPSDIPDLTGRTALVTGANSGLGFWTSVELARHGARVLMACRNPDRASAALDRLGKEAPGGSAELVALDLASLTSVADAATDVAGRTDALDLLVNNAGIMAVGEGRTADGFELQLGTNHLGHFALTGRLLPLLLKGSGPRVVTVSSYAHKIGTIRFDDLMPVLFVWGDQDRLVLPGALRSVEGALPAEVVHGRHGWLLTEPEEFATILRDALVVHAMLERKRRGQSMRFPAGMSLAELIPPERRTHARHEP